MIQKFISIQTYLRVYIFPLLLIGGALSEINFINMEGGIPVRVSLGDFVISILIFIYILIFRKNLINIIKKNKAIIITGLSFIVISLLTGMIANDLWLVSLKSCIKVFLLFILLACVFQDSNISKGALSFLYFIIIIVNIIGLFEFFIPYKIEHLLLLFKSKEALSQYIDVSSVASIFVNPNTYGTFNALFAITLLSIQFYSPRILNKYLFISTSIFTVIGIFISSSRNALFTFSVGICLLSISLIKNKKVSLRWILVSMAIIFMLFFSIVKYNSVLADKLGTVFPFTVKIYNNEPLSLSDFAPRSLSKNIYGRREIWNAGNRLFKENPFFGIGASQFPHRSGLKSQMPNSMNMHNFAGEVLVNHGVTGFILIFVLVIIWFCKTKHFWQTNIIITILSSHIFDCLITYSLIWLIFISWLISLTTKDSNEMFVSE